MAQGDIMTATMTKRPFGQTGSDVSILGLGTVKFGRNKGVKYPGGDGFALPTDGDISSLLDIAIDLGINLLDTAPAYGLAEERLGSIMGARRDRFFLVSKTGEEFDAQSGASGYNFTADHTRLSVERSLQRLKTDYLDCVLVHCNRDDLAVLQDSDVIGTLHALKDAGKIRSFGASTYSIAAGKIAVDRCDAVMVAHNRDYTDEADVIAYAEEHGKAVLVKKGLASGHIADAVALQENIRFVLQTPGVTAMVFGSLNPDNIRKNAVAAAALL